MDVLEDRHRQLIWKKIIPSCFLMLLFLTRFLPFYEIEGIRVETGFGSIVYHKFLFGTIALMFVIGIWKDNINKFIEFILQNISILAMMFYDILYLFFKDFKLKHTCIGFWAYFVISIITLGYCFFIRVRVNENSKGAYR